MDELRVTDEIVDDIKDSIECHLGWFSTKLRSDRSQKDIKNLLWNYVGKLGNFIFFWDAFPFGFTHCYTKMKSFEDNDKPLNKTIFTSGCDDCNFDSLHHKWRYLSAKDFVQTNPNDNLSQYLNKWREWNPYSLIWSTIVE